jgi:hypothetical protein
VTVSAVREVGDETSRGLAGDGGRRHGGCRRRAGGRGMGRTVASGDAHEMGNGGVVAAGDAQEDGGAVAAGAVLEVRDGSRGGCRGRTGGGWQRPRGQEEA